MDRVGLQQDAVCRPHRKQHRHLAREALCPDRISCPDKRVTQQTWQQLTAGLEARLLNAGCPDI